ncbi:MAG: leucyl/phenylalanyl-tRNA--protein transferase [Gammaproteobacteria bacterium]
MHKPTLKLYWIEPGSAAGNFPPVEHALQEPDGLLAVGGDLSPARLLAAYRQGIFPWYSDPQPILWWSPDPRCVLFPGRLHLSHSLGKCLRRGNYRVNFDRAFAAVIAACAAPRHNQPEGGTWITPEMQAAYLELHRLGHAHSVEVCVDGELAGGLYGIAIGRAFFGESMFSRCDNASKIALVFLARQLVAWGYELIDCQVHSPHLARLGAELLPRVDFMRTLAHAAAQSGEVTWPSVPEAGF